MIIGYLEKFSKLSFNFLKSPKAKPSCSSCPSWLNLNYLILFICWREKKSSSMGSSKEMSS
jgi:hypothetical protein